MSGYCKLFSDIVESSVWDEPPEVCKVWITLLALCDKDGYIRGSVGWLANKARVSVPDCQAAIDRFQKPDVRSRTPDHEGRRVELLDDGFLVLNYILFRDRLSDNPLAKATRERVRKHRERYIALRNVTSVTARNSVSVSEDVSVVEERGGCKGEKKPVVLPFDSEEFKEAWQSWKDHRRRIGKAMTDKAQTLILKKLPKAEKEAIAWIENAIEKGWQGIYEPGGNSKQTHGSGSTRPNDPTYYSDPEDKFGIRKAF